MSNESGMSPGHKEDKRMIQKKCSHLDDDKNCKNGFPFTAPCSGIIEGVPVCMDEDRSAVICNRDDGLPHAFPRYTKAHEQ